MSHFAQYIIVEKGQYEVYFSRMGGNTLPVDLFWGPSEAISFIRKQLKMENTEWLDEVSVEGGAVVDLDQKLLLLFGGEDLLCIPLRRVYLQLLAKTWSGWEVRWAHEGMADLADHVGYPRENVIVHMDRPGTDPVLEVVPRPDWTYSIGSFRLMNGEVIIFPLWRDIEYYLPVGPKLIQFIVREKGFSVLDLHHHLKENEFPFSGFHVDGIKRTLDLWSMEPLAEIVRKLKPRWEGWNILWHKDRYEVHAELTEGKIVFPQFEEQRLIAWLGDILLREGREDIFRRTVEEWKRDQNRN